jgi:hypothetical protein
MEPAICAPPLQGNHSLGFARVSHALAGFAQNREKKGIQISDAIVYSAKKTTRSSDFYKPRILPENSPEFQKPSSQ